MPNITRNIIRFGPQDWGAGLSPQYGTTVNDLPPLLGSGLTISKAYDPFRALGDVIPAPNPSAATNSSVLSAIMYNMALGREGSTNYAYFVASDKYLQRMDITNFSVSSQVGPPAWPHELAGAGAESGDDIVAYDMNISSTSTKCIFYSWNDVHGGGTFKWNVGMYELTGSTFNDDWLTTVPANMPTNTNSATLPHPMIVAGLGKLYIGDGNVIHMVNGRVGTDGTYYSNVLTIPKEYTIQAFATTDIHLVIFAYKSTRGDIAQPDGAATAGAVAFFWDYLSDEPEKMISLEDSYVTCAFSYQSGVGCFTAGPSFVKEENGENRFGRLRIYDGTRFTVATQFVGNPPVRGAVKVVNESIQWASDGNIYSFGSPYEGIKSGLNNIGKGTGTTNGFFTIFEGLTGYTVLNSGTTTSGGLEKIQTGYVGTTLVVGPTALPVLAAGKVAKIVSVTTYFGATTSSAGRSVAVSIITDNGSPSTVLTGIEQITSENIVSRRQYTTDGDVLPRFTEIRPSIQYSTGSGSSTAPAVRYIDVEYVLADNIPTV